MPGSDISIFELFGILKKGYERDIMEEFRPNPNELLSQIKEKEEEKKRKRGMLKIFFGYSAGVGKTYDMLKSAHEIKDEGKDVVCGYIEPHTRPATMELVNGLEMIPVKEKEYHGITLKEMDLDAVLKRKQQLVLVDEYAHTNLEGSRHQKRYQDVEEILNAGIDVYTTVNVQHLESLCDIVASITGIVVKERIPDSSFDHADEVKLVDIEPKELLQRLKDGKVYRKLQVKKALDNFFTEEKLTALREIALRRTADRVNITSEKAKRRNKSEYFTEEKILIGLSSSPSNPKIIRAGARMAMAFEGEFIALFVETSSYDNINEKDKKRLKDNMRLAEKLGAKIETVKGDDIAFVIAEYAKISGISKIVVGRSNTRRGFFSKASFTERLIVIAPNLEIYVIPDSNLEKINQKVWNDKHQMKDKIWVTWKDLIFIAILLAVSTIISFLFYDMKFSEVNIITTYILFVMISGILTEGILSSLILAVLSVACFNYFFTAPRFSFLTYNTGYPVTFVITFFAAFFSSSLAQKLKKQSKEIAKVAYRSKVMFDTNQLLQAEKDIDRIGQIVAKQFVKILNRDIIFYGAKDGKLKEPDISFYGSDEKKSVYEKESEKAVANWVFLNNNRAGATTDTLGSAACYYLAIRSLEEVYGVIGIGIDAQEGLEAYENNLIFAVLTETAAYMEKETFRMREQKTAEQVNSEKLRANLLRSISHDLRTPLTSICGNADMMLQTQLDEETKKKICGEIYDDGMWLINLVENLLSVTRIEDKTMNIRLQIELLEDIITEAMSHISRRRENYHIVIEMEDEMQMVLCDSRLIIQVFINLIENALKYTPPGTDIKIKTKKQKEWVVVEVSDNGVGISPENIPKLFNNSEILTTTGTAHETGTGFGLLLCKEFVEKHGGNIWVESEVGKGSTFFFTLPLK